jgi:hypothetical protein
MFGRQVEKSYGLEIYIFLTVINEKLSAKHFGGDFTWISAESILFLGPLRAHAARWLLASGMTDSHLLVVSGVK